MTETYKQAKRIDRDLREITARCRFVLTAGGIMGRFRKVWTERSPGVYAGGFTDRGVSKEIETKPILGVGGPSTFSCNF